MIHRTLFILAVGLATLAASAPARGQTLAKEIEPRPAPPPKESAEDAFRRSLSQNISEQSGDPRLIIAFFCGAAGLIIAAAVINRWRTRPGAGNAAAGQGARPLNHPGKLLKEIAKGVNLRPAEMRQLKMLSQEQGIQSPLVLLLCPSALAKAAREARRADRSILSVLARKLAKR